MKQEQLYRIIEPHAPIGLKYFTFLNSQLPSIKGFKSVIGTQALKKVLDLFFPDQILGFYIVSAQTITRVQLILTVQK